MEVPCKCSIYMERNPDLIAEGNTFAHAGQLDNDDPNFDRKLDLITAGAKPFVKEHLLTRITKENRLVIMNYVLGLMTELNPSEQYRVDTILKAQAAC